MGQSSYLILGTEVILKIIEKNRNHLNLFAKTWKFAGHFEKCLAQTVWYQEEGRRSSTSPIKTNLVEVLSMPCWRLERYPKIQKIDAPLLLMLFPKETLSMNEEPIMENGVLLGITTEKRFPETVPAQLLILDLVKCSRVGVKYL